MVTMAFHAKSSIFVHSVFSQFNFVQFCFGVKSMSSLNTGIIKSSKRKITHIAVSISFFSFQLQRELKRLYCSIAPSRTLFYPLFPKTHDNIGTWAYRRNIILMIQIPSQLYLTYLSPKFRLHRLKYNTHVNFFVFNERKKYLVF